MHQSSRGIVCQYGSGSFPVYRGQSRQYGYGLGSIFKTALRMIVPLLKPVAKAGLQSVKQVAKDQGIHALRDIVAGNNVKQVLKSRGKTALKSFGQSALDRLASGQKDIKSSRPQAKAHSSTSRRTVNNKNQKGKKTQKGKKHSSKRNAGALSRKYPNLKFEPDVFGK